MLFKKSKCENPTVRSQYEEKAANRWKTVLDFLNRLFREPEDEFVVLTLADIKHNIRYVQSTWTPEGLIVQLGIEGDGGTRLVEKNCSEKECVEIFREFYETSDVPNIQEYSEVKF